MKRNFLILVGICFLFLFAGQANAQKEEYNKAMRYRYMPYEKQVEEVLTNLTDNQRKMLHKLSKENKEYMDKYRKDRDQLKKTIKSLLEMKEDVSEALFPLIDMKARLEAEKEKNLYKMKLKIGNAAAPVITNNTRTVIIRTLCFLLLMENPPFWSIFVLYLFCLSNQVDILPFGWYNLAGLV